MKTDQYDSYIAVTDWLQQRDQPVAITLTEILEPAGGSEAIIFPPTYAFREEDKHRAKAENWLPYAISVLRKDANARMEGTQCEGNICELDAVGSQANRMESLFSKSPLNSLTPQVLIKAKDAEVNLLDIGHRIADGVVRLSDLANEATKAFASLANDRDALPLAQLAPTSLLFGFWNSREKESPKLAIKYPRILSSTIRATNVAPVRRSAQFNAAIDSKSLGLSEILPEESLSEIGLDSVPAAQTHGGVRVFGEITRRSELNLVALRALAVSGEDRIDEVQTLKLRRYLLGLGLVAARVQAAYNLRQGCLLVLKHSATPSAQTVFPNGKREDFTWDFKTAFQFAVAAAKDFGIFQEKPEPRTFALRAERISEALKAKTDDKAARKAAKAAKKKPAA